MILPKKEDALHKAWLLRLLTEILDSKIAQNVYFKGGTAATLLGFLDRFSLDLDFDLKPKSDVEMIDRELKKIFNFLDLKLEKKSSLLLFYVLKYPSPPNQRNTIKLSLTDLALKSNQYETFYLKDIDRFAICQTKETMFANKLVAIIDRYQKYKTIAGRDLYDIHHFFIYGYDYLDEVIIERTGKKPKEYLRQLIDFIEEKVSDKIISQDLSFLLPYERFVKIRKILKQEVLMFLKEEVKKVKVRLFLFR